MRKLLKVFVGSLLLSEGRTLNTLAYVIVMLVAALVWITIEIFKRI